MVLTDELRNAKGIVYMITNTVNGKRYIGITINSFAERYPHGIRNHHNPHLRQAVKKYGQDNFEITLLEKGVKDLETLCRLEMKYIKEYDTCNKEKGYNKSLGGLGVRQTERSKEHCRNLSRAKKNAAVNTLARMSPETLREWLRKHSEAMKGKRNPMYGMAKDKLKPETLEKLRKASLGKNNPMYGKNIKDFMSPEAYEEWKKKVARPGAKNGRARKTIVIYKGKKYEFDYCREAIRYFKETLKEPISINWLYRGINPQYKNKFQFFGYDEDYQKFAGCNNAG